MGNAEFGEPIRYVEHQGLMTTDDRVVGSAWPGYRGRIVECYNAFEGIPDPAAWMEKMAMLVVVATEHSFLCKQDEGCGCEMLDFALKKIAALGDSDPKEVDG